MMPDYEDGFRVRLACSWNRPRTGAQDLIEEACPVKCLCRAGGNLSCNIRSLRPRCLRTHHYSLEPRLQYVPV